MGKSYSSKFKSKVALEAIQRESTIAEITEKYQVHVNQVQQWKKRLMDGVDGIFATAAERRKKNHKPYTEDKQMKKIGRLEAENDFLRQVASRVPTSPAPRSMAARHTSQQSLTGSAG